MLKRIRLMLFSLSAILSLSIPAFSALTVSAAVGQDNFNNSLCAGANGDFTGATNGNCNEQAEAAGNTLLTTVINVISIIVGVIAVIMIIFAGFRYITSGGKQESVSGAKNTILYAIIGLVIVALAQIIVRFVLAKTTDASTTGGP